MSNLVVLNAKLKNKNYSNTGYIIINGNSIEGIFTLDYVEILNEHNRLKMLLSQKTFHQENSSFSKAIEYFFSKTDTTLYCPENYVLSNGSEKICLNILSKVTDKNKISLIEKELSLLKI